MHLKLMVMMMDHLQLKNQSAFFVKTELLNYFTNYHNLKDN